MIAFRLVIAVGIALTSLSPAFAGQSSTPPAARANENAWTKCVIEKDPAKVDEIFFSVWKDENPHVSFSKQHPCFQPPFSDLVNQSSYDLATALQMIAEYRLEKFADCLILHLPAAKRTELNIVKSKYLDRYKAIQDSPEKFRVLVGAGAGACNADIFEVMAEDPYSRGRLLSKMVERLPDA